MTPSRKTRQTQKTSGRTVVRAACARGQDPGEAELEVGEGVPAQLRLGSVLGVGQDGRHGLLPQVEVAVGQGALLLGAQGRVGEVGVEVLAVDGPGVEVLGGGRRLRTRQACRRATIFLCTFLHTYREDWKTLPAKILSL